MHTEEEGGEVIYDDETSALLGEIVANAHIIDAKVDAMRALFVEKGLFTHAEFMEKFRQVIKREAAAEQEEFQRLAWDSLLKNRPKQ